MHRAKALETIVRQALACVVEVVDMEEAKVWPLEPMAEAALRCEVVVISHSLLCHQQMLAPDRTMTSKDDLAQLDTLVIHRETSRVTGETSLLKDQLPHKISKVKWAALVKVSNSRAVSSQATAIGLR